MARAQLRPVPAGAGHARPTRARFSEILHTVGEAARDANRVEVPFEFIAPKPDGVTGPSTASKGVDVPLGRAGATKLQHLKLGKGTSQHVLIAGKTGSGKSTLLHALITNAALRYSPDELELYLIDFKKGVEFKVYAAMELPHARVIAVESEREFGLSVLQRLDVELKERGEIYREVGVPGPGGYREARPEAPDAADPAHRRRVPGVLRRGRQDRAGGHAAAGPPGAPGPCLRHSRHPRLADPGRRSTRCREATLGQMAVRIALQCSEADAHLILSEDNTAARLLTRPGEAIYNDANGMIEGNNLFQVVWLSDEQPRGLPGDDPGDVAAIAERPQAAADRLRGQPAGRCASKNPLLNRPARCSRTGPSRRGPTRPGWATRSRSRTRRPSSSARRAAATS